LQLSLWASFAVALAAIAYYPILGHYFFADDFYNLYRIQNDPLLQYILQPQGGHLLVTTHIIFYLSDLLFGADPYPYFAGVLALHLVNTVLLFALIRRMTGSDLAACTGAALWAVCPTHEGTLGWYSVFGHVVLATTVLWLLYDVAGVERNAAPGWGKRIRWVILILIGATSFGVGLATGMVFPLLAWLMIPPGRARLPVVILFAAVALCIPVLYVSLHRLYQGPQIGLQTPFAVGVHLIRQYGTLLTTLIGHMAAYGIATTLVSTARPALHFPSPLADAVVAVFGVGCALTLGADPHAGELRHDHRGTHSILQPQSRPHRRDALPLCRIHRYRLGCVDHPLRGQSPRPDLVTMAGQCAGSLARRAARGTPLERRSRRYDAARPRRDPKCPALHR
jgi:hypothetical protein